MVGGLIKPKWQFAQTMSFHERDHHLLLFIAITSYMLSSVAVYYIAVVVVTIPVFEHKLTSKFKLFM